MDRYEPPPAGTDVGRQDDRQPVSDEETAAGDPACWAHLICPECGSVLVEGHRPRCPVAESE
ncbi:MAG TPA: hypothetical protein VMV23_12975 [Candidatus Nanopelagicaceae bacterium]|nr:hypothetical protein [Candidatus Nanopelagicaceae bacterium]